ncbi:FAD-dependent oxidoreductase, partial [Francisella tularensis]|uniref:FAD-dependent oxidoreductase n=1 Tax=Francisella tularensis TaxID=263 RepID=UPI00174D4636
GKTAVEEALFLSNIAKSVTLIHRRDTLRSETILIDKLMDKVQPGNINIIWNTTLEEVLGDEMGINALRIKNIKNTEESQIADAGVFIAIGHTHTNSIFAGQLDIENGYIKMNTSIADYATQTNNKDAISDCVVSTHVYTQGMTSD